MSRPKRKFIPRPDPVSADRVRQLEPVAAKAMEMASRHKQHMYLAGIGPKLSIHSRDLRAPVHCAGCHTVYEGSETSCPACGDSTAIGPVTELSMQVAKIREAQREKEN